MARVQFKAKPEVDAMGREGVRIPRLKAQHCDMAAFRVHPRFGAYANSKLFPGMLSRLRYETFGMRDFLPFDSVPAGVAVDRSGFLTTVSFDV